MPSAKPSWTPKRANKVILGVCKTRGFSLGNLYLQKIVSRNSGSLLFISISSFRSFAEHSHVFCSCPPRTASIEALFLLILITSSTPSSFARWSIFCLKRSCRPLPNWACHGHCGLFSPPRPACVLGTYGSNALSSALVQNAMNACAIGQHKVNLLFESVRM